MLLTTDVILLSEPRLEICGNGEQRSGVVNGGGKENFLYSKSFSFITKVIFQPVLLLPLHSQLLMFEISFTKLFPLLKTTFTSLGISRNIHNHFLQVFPLNENNCFLIRDTQLQNLSPVYKLLFLQNKTLSYLWFY